MLKLMAAELKHKGELLLFCSELTPFQKKVLGKKIPFKCLAESLSPLKILSQLVFKDNPWCLRGCGLV